jgi:hypothetical protein
MKRVLITQLDISQMKIPRINSAGGQLFFVGAFLSSIYEGRL